MGKLNPKIWEVGKKSNSRFTLIQPVESQGYSPPTDRQYQTGLIKVADHHSESNLSLRNVYFVVLS